MNFSKNIESYTAKKTDYILYGLFLLALCFNIAFWLHGRKIITAWNNVPPAPSRTAAVAGALGDPGIAYRMAGYFLQNTGNVGGNFTSLRDYDYARLEEWFFLAHSLDDRSDYVPFMAAYYFGARENMEGGSQNPELTHVLNYLEAVGKLPYPQKWRWLAHASYLARFKQGKAEEALRLAYEIQNLDTDVAPWAKQLPAFIQVKMGNKQAAYDFMVQMLASEHDKVHPNEVREMIRFICTRTLDKAEADKNPLCKDMP